jgi:prenylcysteine alpha-carboxyl methylesterase
MRNIGRLRCLSKKLICGAMYVRAFLLILMNLSLLGIYVIILLPAFLQMAWFYVTTNRISVRYKNDSCRNTVDVYGFDPKSFPKGNNLQQQKQPVVFFLPGGAYCLGYKMWGALVAQALRPSGVLVVSADYRNYPFGKVPDMIQDAADALQWTIDHCHEYGGDQSRIVIVGQSAGAHLGMMALLLNQTRSNLSQNIRGFVGLSGIYDMQVATNLFSRKLSLHPSVVSEQLFSQQPDSCDPAVWLTLHSSRPILPPIELWHGSSDKTVRNNIQVRNLL